MMLFRQVLKHNLVSRTCSRALLSTKSSPVEAIGNVSEALPDNPLKDRFGRRHNYLRVSLTEKCNFRCVYCMPEEGVELTPKPNLPTLEERTRLLTIFAGLGVNKLRFTGGEPTISKQLVPLVHHAHHTLGITSIGMTTNGLLLTQQLPALVTAGLTSVNVSLDSLEEKKFAKLTRRSGKSLPRVLSSVYAAVSAGLHVKINCVLMRGVNDDELAAFVQLTKDCAVDVRFIEYMPFDGNKWATQKMMGYKDALSRLEAEHGMLLHVVGSAQAKVAEEEAAALETQGQGQGNSINSMGITMGNKIKDLPGRGFDPHDTTKWYRHAGYEGRVGFISTMTEHFCGGCNRLRVTADGKLKACLFGQEEVSLLDSLREGLGDDQIVKHIAGAVTSKHKALGGHGDAQDLVGNKNRSMILIGG